MKENSKICPSCAEKVNPAFNECWKCSYSFVTGKSENKSTHGTSWREDLRENWSAVGDSLAIGLGFIFFIALIIFGWGYMSDVVFGKMTTGQYIEKLRYEITTEWPAKIRPVLQRVADVEIPRQISNQEKGAALERLSATIHHQQVSQYQFASEFIDSLAYIKQGQDRALAWDEDKVRADAHGVELMKSMRYTIDDFRKAQWHIEPYRQSENEMIKFAAERITESIGHIIRLSKQFLALVENLHANETPETFNPGKYSVAESRLAVEMENAYELLMYSAVAVTHALVSRTPDEQGQLSSLAISEKEKQSLIQKLEDTFRPKPVPDFEAGGKYGEGSASVLYHFLTTSKHQTKGL